jgi:hypothetical protein
VHDLTPLSDDKWNTIRGKIDKGEPVHSNANPPSESASFEDVARMSFTDNDFLVNAHREIRAKLYMGKVCVIPK